MPEDKGKIAIILAGLGAVGTALYFILKKKVAPPVVPPVEEEEVCASIGNIKLI